MGIPTGLQFSITAIGSMVMQSANNGLGSVCVSGFHRGNEDQAVYYVSLSTLLEQQSSVFCSQNLGSKAAGPYPQGTEAGHGSCSRIWTSGRPCSYFCRKTSFMIFVSKSSADVLDASAKYLRCMGYFYWSLGILNTTRMVTQGLGYSTRAVFFRCYGDAGEDRCQPRDLLGTFGFTAICFADQTAWITACLYIAPTCVFCIKKATKSIMAGAYE